METKNNAEIKFVASLSKGRNKWCIIFPHPMIPDDKTGKVGVRVRRGLGTDNKAEAQEIVDHVNAMLGNDEYWKMGARDLASRQFKPKAVSAFYDHDRLQVAIGDPWEKRNEVLPLPLDTHSVVQIVGPYGVGKTTLIRQMLGTNPETERFPATSKGRSTICDTEIICSPGAYSAVISFLSHDRVLAYIEECVEAAVSAAAEGLDDKQIARCLLEHTQQRFRLSYTLGKVLVPAVEDQDEDDDGDSDETVAGEEAATETSHLVTDHERQQNSDRILDWVKRCKEIAAAVCARLEDETGDSMEDLALNDKDAFLQLVDECLQENEDVKKIEDEVMEAAQERFQFPESEAVDRDSSGWPIRWQITTEDRKSFLRQVNRFSSNYEKLYGRLLTPMVDGIRVKGPFRPKGWAETDEIPPLIFLDGEGLGHVHRASVNIPSSVTKRYGMAHAILLVDTSERAMDVGPKALMRSVVTSGHEKKLAVVFTHFDRMKSDAFRTAQDKQNHVLSSLEQAIVSLDETIDGPAGASRRVRKQLADHVFFVGHIQEEIDPESKSTRGTRKALNQLVHFLIRSRMPEVPTDAVPRYDLAYLFPGIHKATDTFQREMNHLLMTEHWKKVEALTRRFAKQWEDGYKELQPVAKLRGMLLDKLNAFFANPKSWQHDRCTQEAKDIAIQNITRAFSASLEVYVSRRFREDELNAWRAAFGRSGRGSGRSRSSDVRMIDENVAPVPGEQKTSKLFDDIRSLCQTAIIDGGGEVIGGVVQVANN
jgi:energy-coupling factor transporter ATP-binding protein EcfA2